MLSFESFRRKYQKVPIEEYPNRVLEAVPEPMVSVQVSTYQHADFIRDCLDGILMQETDFPVEILIGEDESSDGTREICKEYADRHPDTIRLFLHRRENNIHIHGRPTPRFQSTYTRFKCRGKYIALCEGDDYWTDPLKLQKQVSLLESYPNLAGSFHKTIDMEHATGQIKKTFADKTPEIVTAENTITTSSPFHTSSFLCRRECSDVPEWATDFISGDLILFATVARHGPLAKVDEVMSVRRRHPGGITQPDARKPDYDRQRIKLMKRIHQLHRGEHKNKLKEVVKCHQISGEFGRHYWMRVVRERVAFRSRLRRISSYLIKTNSL